MGGQVQFRHMTTVFAATILIACGADSNETVGDAVPATETAVELSQEEIQQLALQYPRLGEEPLPEPKPSPDADPANAPNRVLETATGEATYYANHFEGRRTASGIPFRQNQMVAAHRAYPFGTILRVTNLANDRSVNVRVVDRGPFGSSAKAQRTILDLSRRAAGELGYTDAGRARVRVEVLEWGSGIGSA